MHWYLIPGVLDGCMHLKYILIKYTGNISYVLKKPLGSYDPGRMELKLHFSHLMKNFTFFLRKVTLLTGISQTVSSYSGH